MFVCVVCEREEEEMERKERKERKGEEGEEGEGGEEEKKEEEDSPYPGGEQGMLCMTHIKSSSMANLTTKTKYMRPPISERVE